ncbi:cytochrome P450 [Micromonospora carbonacea]|uniref:Cytochrome P450 n=1 Tax=Micromonospora carbonacea TaxID=47853 RepID=A0A1C4YSU3_9ACTN|nr:cytochrome P450 [Micromonospora carbonacea]SCF23740.1 Cytochrome P450 [Micromonospora carbonacea]
MSHIRSPEAATPPGISPLPGGLGWVVADREAAVGLLSDDRLGVVESTAVMASLTHGLADEVRPMAEELGAFAERIMLQASPERHAGLRRAFGRFFTADAVEAMVPALRALADRVVGRFAAAGGGEFMTAVAFRYAIECGAHLLGLSPEEYHRLHKLSQRLALVAYAARLPDPAAAVTEGHAALAEIRRSLRRARPQAPPGSVLGAWHAGWTGGLAEEDFEANIVMLVQASLETVAGMLGNAAIFILGSPAASDPAHREAMLDEALRSEPPLKTLERVAHAPITFGDLHVRAGQIISVRVAEANRPDDRVAGRAVLSFGWGAYRCLGARLARYQAIELFDALHRAAPGAVLVDDEIERIRHIRFNMPRRLMVRCPAAEPEPDLARMLTESLAEHDLDRPLSSVERVMAAATLEQNGHTVPDHATAPTTIRGWLAWATTHRG